MAASDAACESWAMRSSKRRVLLAYFSRAGENYWHGGRRTLTVGNTEVLAEMIADRVDCEVYRIEPADTYSEGYDDTVARNVTEQNTDARPRIAHPLPSVADYDDIIVASPIWNVRPSMIMSTFLDQIDLTGKRLFPVVTYAVSGLGQAVPVYRALAPDASIGPALAVRGARRHPQRRRHRHLGQIGGLLRPNPDEPHTINITTTMKWESI